MVITIKRQILEAMALVYAPIARHLMLLKRKDY
jgi:hypothetical protein